MSAGHGFFRRPSIAIWVGVGLLVALAGCGSGKLKTYPIRGEVVFADGTPVKTGTVETKSVEHGVQASGTIATDGTFTLSTFQPNDGAVAGKHRCVVVQFLPVEDIPNYRPSTLGVVNRKHASYASSGLEFSVSEGGDNRVRLVVAGADPIRGSSEDHGHDEIPPDSAGASGG